MLGDQGRAGDVQHLNSRFLNWASAAVVNPKNGFYFCDRWFVTSVTRGRPMDIAVEPLNAESDSGFRLVMRKPPEQVRIWHKLPDGLLESGKKFVKVRLRGVGEAEALHLDSVALFHGNEINRKIDRRLVGAITLSPSWHEFTAELRGGGAANGDARYLSLRFSGNGNIEVEFCRLEENRGVIAAWPAARSLAAKVLSGFPRRRTSPVEETPEGLEESEKEVLENPAAALLSAVVQLETEKAASPKDEGRKPKDRPEQPASGSPPVADHKKGPNILQNSSFLSWSDRGPENWKVGLPTGATIRRARLAVDSPFKTAGLSLDCGKLPSDRMVSISQRVTGELAPKRIIELVVVGSSDKRTEVEIALIGPSGVVAGARTAIVLRSRWHFRTARLVVPQNFSGTDGSIALFVRGGQGAVVNLAFVAAGAPGEDIAGQFEVRELPATESNVVCNGQFDHWSGPVTQALSLRRTAITDDWLLVNKAPSPSVEARLTEILPRGLRDGREHEPVLALAMLGEPAGSYVRMEAALDALQILAGPPRQLSFYGRTAAPSSPDNGTPRARAMIHQIFVGQRRRLTPESNEFEVTRLFTVRRNLRIGRIGESHVIDLRPEHRALLQAKAGEMLHDVSRSLLLIFECSGFVDVAIGDVRFGNGAEAGPTKLAVSGEVVLEDPSIAAQLTHLKGLAHWQSPVALTASAPLPQGSSSDQATWTWLSDSKLTVDIAICVHNAVEETLGCLESLRRYTTVPHTVTIIDDKSNDLTRERLREYVAGKPWIRLLENPENLGYTRSANIGLSTSSAEWVVLLNSDTIVTPGWLEGLFDVVKARPNVAMVGPLSNAASWQSVPETHDMKGGWSINPIPEGLSVVDVAQLVADLSPKEFPEATLLNGFCTLMRRDVIEQVGYLDEVAFPMGYGEENDLCLRVRKAGYSLALADHVYVYHVKSASFGSARRSELSKRGNANLHAKHPDVDMKEVQKEMAELTSLITLRKRLRRSFGSAVVRSGRRADGGQAQMVVSSLTH